jgi:hypothetical protein
LTVYAYSEINRYYGTKVKTMRVSREFSGVYRTSLSERYAAE